MSESTSWNTAPVRRTRLTMMLGLTVLLLAACAPMSPRPTPSPPTLDLANLSAEQRAVILALQAQPLFVSDAVGDGGITLFDENAIGQANWYQVARGRSADAILVTVRLGWGDCQSGCIDEHRYEYTVVNDTITGVVESGVSFPPFDFGPGGPSSLMVSASAGPTCPVVSDPPDPACADRPVADAVVTATPVKGDAREAHTGADGTYTLNLPAGIYLVTAESATVGLPGAEPQSVVLALGADGVGSLAFSFDTGIR